MTATALNLIEQLGLMSEDETAKFFGVTIGTLRNWRTEGRGPVYVKAADKAIRYPISGLKDFVKANTIDPAANKPPTLSGSRSRRRSHVATA